MNKSLLIAIIIALSFGLAAAQDGKIVFGPLDGDSAGDMLVENNSSITIPVYVRTSPGINIVGLHWPLGTNDIYIASRDGINYDYAPLRGQNPGDSSWARIYVLDPNSMTGGYTNQGMLATKDFPIRDPYPEDGINTNGEWWHVADYFMTTTGGNETEVQFCDVFEAGHHPDNGGFVWYDYTYAELPPENFEYSYACVTFANNSYPTWCPINTDFCADAGVELCLDLCGDDINLNDDLHIIQTGGPGEYIEDTGGPGGHTSGTWCGNLGEGTHVLSFELSDTWGVVPLDLTVEMRPVSLEIGCVSGFSGGMATVPVTANTCSFRPGGIQVLMAWDPDLLYFSEVIPTGRIDDGHEYWNVYEGPCEDCSDLRIARIIWISDIANGFPHDPAYAGDDPVFLVKFRIPNAIPVGTEIPVVFHTTNNLDNTLTDSTGFTWFRPDMIDGCVNILDPDQYKGDPNVNGRFYEVGDAMLVVRCLIYGDVVWAENGMGDDDVQKSSADLNNNHIIEFTDLARFINIIIGKIMPPKLEPISSPARINVVSHESSLDFTFDSPVEAAGILMNVEHPGMELGTPSAPGMELMYNDEDGVMRIVVYSMEGNTFAGGSSSILSIPIISDDNGTVVISDASSSDAYGRELEVRAAEYQPLPDVFTVMGNYPNPFNAQTKITFAMPEKARVKVEIFDLLGRSVEILTDRELEAGLHSVVWDSANRSSGTYFYRIKSGDAVETRKMVLLK